MKRYLTSLAVVACSWAGPLAAHPHVFVDLAVTFVADAEGHVVGVEVEWRYDELYSLLILEDMGLDPEADGVLQVQGFDLNWIPEFQGDIYVEARGGPLSLTAPEGRGTEVVAGQLISRHYRSLEVPQGEVVLRGYDPTFYTAYDLAGRVQVPEGCNFEITTADLDAAYTLVEEALYKDPPKDDDEYPEVGAAFADRVAVTCRK